MRLLYALILLGFPLLEIATFVAIGSRIGALNTILLVVASGIAGVAVLRSRGLGLIERIRRAAADGRSVDREVARGAITLGAGILLLVPGFLTDLAALILLLPPVQDLAWQRLRSRIVVATSHDGWGRPGGPARGGPTIDLDEDDFERTGSPEPEASPWRRRELE